MYEEGADFRGVAAWIEKRIFSPGPLIAAEKSFAFAPSAATDCDYFCATTFCFRFSLRFNFSDEIGFVGDELGIDAENTFQCAFNLLGRVVVCLQTADGGVNERAQLWDVGCDGFANLDLEVHLNCAYLLSKVQIFRR